jgi:hypothetical protein
MPPFSVVNTTARTLSVRTATGIRRLAPGAASPKEGFDLAPSHAVYYGKAGAKVTPLEPAKAQEAPAGNLDDFDASQVADLAAAENIDLGEIDLNTDEGLALGKATITEFRRIWATGNADSVRADAVAAGIDLGDAKAKYEIVNRIVAHNGVTVE